MEFATRFRISIFVKNDYQQLAQSTVLVKKGSWLKHCKRCVNLRDSSWCDRHHVWKIIKKQKWFSSGSSGERYARSSYYFEFSIKHHILCYWQKANIRKSAFLLIFCQHGYWKRSQGINMKTKYYSYYIYPHCGEYVLE